MLEQRVVRGHPARADRRPTSYLRSGSVGHPPIPPLPAPPTIGRRAALRTRPSAADGYNDRYRAHNRHRTRHETPIMFPFSSSSPRFEQRAQGGIALLSSLCAHVALLLVLALCVYTSGRDSRGVLFTARMDASDATSVLALTPQFELQPEVAPPSPVEPATGGGDFAIDVDIDLPDRGDDPSDPVGAQLASISAADVVANLRPGSGRRGASFFGTYASGNRFVYVLDSSRSMLGDRWVYACNQLIDSLNGLADDQEFVVICFDLTTTFMFNKSPANVHYLHPTPAIVSRIRRWLRSVELGRATMPAQAMQYALELNPDAIFLLSDGELQDNTVAVLRLLNPPGSERRQIPVHTVHLFSFQGRLTLQQIALENSGTFTSIQQQRSFRTFPSR